MISNKVKINIRISSRPYEDFSTDDEKEKKLRRQAYNDNQYIVKDIMAVDKVKRKVAKISVLFWELCNSDNFLEFLENFFLILPTTNDVFLDKRKMFNKMGSLRLFAGDLGRL